MTPKNETRGSIDKISILEYRIPKFKREFTQPIQSRMRAYISSEVFKQKMSQTFIRAGIDRQIVPQVLAEILKIIFTEGSSMKLTFPKIPGKAPSTVLDTFRYALIAQVSIQDANLANAANAECTSIDEYITAIRYALIACDTYATSTPAMNMDRVNIRYLNASEYELLQSLKALASANLLNRIAYSVTSQSIINHSQIKHIIRLISNCHTTHLNNPEAHNYILDSIVSSNIDSAVFVAAIADITKCLPDPLDTYEQSRSQQVYRDLEAIGNAYDESPILTALLRIYVHAFTLSNIKQ